MASTTATPIVCKKLCKQVLCIHDYSATRATAKPTASLAERVVKLNIGKFLCENEPQRLMLGGAPLFGIAAPGAIYLCLLEAPPVASAPLNCAADMLLMLDGCSRGEGV
jgi:hypothetical protein